MNQIPNITLNNGVLIPQIGLGVYKAEEGGQVESAMDEAFRCGYRLVDTAAAYGNEAGVGRAVRNSGLAREEIFVTTKLWNDSHRYDDALRAFDESMKKLDCDYLDLYLIHWPLPMEGNYPEAWRAMEKLYTDGRIRAIGVSNFTPGHLEHLEKTANIVPSLNQIELHPRLQQKATRDYCASRDIAVEAWSPFMRSGELFEIPVIAEAARNHSKTAAQIVLRWHVQSGFIVIPKSVNAARIRENISVFDFKLSPEEMSAIETLDENKRSGADPQTADFK